MDNLPIHWGPKPGLVTLCGVVALAAAGGAAWFGTTGDPAGALLLGVVTVFFAATTVHCALVRPRLTTDASGITVRTLSGRLQAPWRRVQYRVVTTRRLGRNVDTLELDIADEQPGAEPEFVVLGELELGADPNDVLERLWRAE
ncbi:PH domain-containing protein [Haloechinothrix alba]|uniref:PH domain-containing protein n=1 Tax=Haloechinothrix alba TaxID=664784 RepID=UPI001FECA23F|nr:PH domain-containing protein [Haloechinothrix alba]